MNLENIGKSLRELRISQKKTINEAAALARVNDSSWSRIERGCHKPNMETLQRMYGVLGYRLTFEVEPIPAKKSKSIRKTDSNI